MKNLLKQRDFVCEICNSYFAPKKPVKLAYFISAWRKEDIQIWVLWLLTYICSQKSRLNQHVATVHEGKKSFKCDICDYKCWVLQITLHQFMKDSSHWNVKVVIIALLLSTIWKQMFHHFMKEISHSSVAFVITDFLKQVTLGALHVL